jgi:hypothetical protein
MIHAHLWRGVGGAGRGGGSGMDERRLGHAPVEERACTGGLK